MALSTAKPWWAVGKIQHGGNPFASMGDDWCPHCRLIGDTDEEAQYRSGVYSYRRICRRCGYAVKWGAYQVPLITRQDLPPSAVRWVTRPEKDRR